MKEEKKKSLKTQESIPAFFFLPDISGFTNFIQNTNLKEGARLIHDLLEVIIDSNILDLEIAEIQGDAIWFYKLGAPVSISELEKQTIKTFTDFQAALTEMEEKHELLAGAKDLTLKIIVHYGRISTTTVKGTLKLIGTNSVIAHRILKNNIKGNEYLLMTDQYLKTQENFSNQGKQPFGWDYLKQGSCTYEHLGPVNYQYVLLTPLREKFMIP